MKERFELEMDITEDWETYWTVTLDSLRCYPSEIQGPLSIPLYFGNNLTGRDTVVGRYVVYESLKIIDLSDFTPEVNHKELGIRLKFPVVVIDGTKLYFKEKGGSQIPCSHSNFFKNFKCFPDDTDYDTSRFNIRSIKANKSLEINFKGEDLKSAQDSIDERYTEWVCNVERKCRVLGLELEKLRIFPTRKRGTNERV